MSARDLFDRQLRLIAARDLDGLAGQYHEDAVLVRFASTHGGHAAIREFFATYLAQGPVVKEVTEVVATEDVVSYHATMELGGEEVRVHGTLVLKGERIWRQSAGLFPAPAPARAKGTVTVELEPYEAWVPRPVPDPRTAGREAIGPLLLEIVSLEGPILAGRAYRLYVKASGGKALTSISRAPLSGAAHRLKLAGAIEMDGDGDEAVLRLAGTQLVRVRELGPRTLEEVPLDEIATLMGRLVTAGAEPDALPRAVLDSYGLVRMTAKAEAYLELARSSSGR